MEGTLRSLRLPAVVLLFLCTAPSRLDAQQFVCWPITAGDTASSLARRLTGNAESAYGLGFQIRDPARRMFVPKSHYERLQSDWQACVAPGQVANTQVAYAPVVTLATSAMPTDEPIGTTPPAFASTALTVAPARKVLDYLPSPGVIGAALLVIVLLSTAGSLAGRPMPASVRRAGENFATVFARPLIDPSSPAPPIEMQLRYVRRNKELEIFLAPGPGHRYPNMTDHKKNLEYDIARVLGVLEHYALSKPPRAQGKWVVVTISPLRPGTSSPDPLLAHSFNLPPVERHTGKSHSVREALSLTARALHNTGNTPSSTKHQGLK